MTKLYFLTYFLLALSIHSFGQPGKNKQVIKKLDQLIAEKYKSIAPGCVVLVARNGQVFYNKAFGTANNELNVPMRPEMVFRIGSITKEFTAIAILQLAEQGKISLKDSLQRFIRDFPYKGHTITIENLLTHTSGIADYEVLNFNIPNAIRIDFPQKQIIDSLAKLPLEFKPGDKFAYSNSNYFLLGYIIEQVSGKTYKDYLQENICKPADLSGIQYDDPFKVIANRVNGYTKDNSGFYNAGYISMAQVFSAGGLLSNAEDLFKWHQVLYTYKLVKKETLEKALTSFSLSNGAASGYGYGWFIKGQGNDKSIGHGGAIDGFRSMETYFPKDDIYVAALFNSDDDKFFTIFEDITHLITESSSNAVTGDVIIEQKVLDSYAGIYRPIEDTTEFFRIYKEGDKLYADLSNKTGMHMLLVAKSQTLFVLPVVKRIPTTIEFIVDDGKVKGLYWTQEKKHEARKSE